MNVNTQPPNPLQAQGITGAPTRNSSIELLRLACILMFVGFPYVLVSANEWLAQQPITVSKIACQMIMAGGWIGSKLALRRGAKLVRYVMLGVLALLVVKLAVELAA